MNLSDAKRAMKEAIELGDQDPEAASSLARQTLLSFLRSEGYVELAQLYEKVPYYF